MKRLLSSRGKVCFRLGLLLAMFVAENMRESCGLWYLPALRGRWLRGSAPHLRTGSCVVVPIFGCFLRSTPLVPKRTSTTKKLSDGAPYRKAPSIEARKSLLQRTFYVAWMLGLRRSEEHTFELQSLMRTQ